MECPPARYPDADGPTGLRGLCHLLGPPLDVALGEVERLLLPLCTRGTILSIGREPGRLVVEFESPGDAADCVGSHWMRDTVVRCELAHPVQGRAEELLLKGSLSAKAKSKAAAEEEEMQSARREKERRLNRVGLSYRCGRCGQPKRGHVCTPGPGGAPRPGSGPPAGTPLAPTPKFPSSLVPGPPPPSLGLMPGPPPGAPSPPVPVPSSDPVSPPGSFLSGSEWELESDSIFKATRACASPGCSAPHPLPSPPRLLAPLIPRPRCGAQEIDRVLHLPAPPAPARAILGPPGVWPPPGAFINAPSGKIQAAPAARKPDRKQGRRDDGSPTVAGDAAEMHMWRLRRSPSVSSSDTSEESRTPPATAMGGGGFAFGDVTSPRGGQQFHGLVPGPDGVPLPGLLPYPLNMTQPGFTARGTPPVSMPQAPMMPG